MLQYRYERFGSVFRRDSDRKNLAVGFNPRGDEINHRRRVSNG